jgi:hypothetical protein
LFCLKDFFLLRLTTVGAVGSLEALSLSLSSSPFSLSSPSFASSST